MNNMKKITAKVTVEIKMNMDEDGDFEDCVKSAEWLAEVQNSQADIYDIEVLNCEVTNSR